jgi:FKBP-type peptidyl-prolyl cis-trans isomerase (trigger factor)
VESIVPADAVLVDTKEADALLEEKIKEPLIEALAPPYRVVMWFKYEELRKDFDKFWEENSNAIIANLGLKGKKGSGGVMPAAKSMAEKRIPVKKLYASVLVEKLRSKVPDIFFLEGWELFEFEPGKTTQMVAILYFYPKLTLKEQINWGCKKPPEQNRQEQLEQRHRELQMQFRKLEDDPDGVVTELTNIQMDVTASIEGQPYPNGTFLKQWVDISGIPMKDLVQQLIGHRAGDLFECDYSASPRDPEAAGKTVHATIKIHNLQKIIIPPVDDDLARDAEFDDLKSFEERFNKDYDAYVRNMQRAIIADHVIGHIVRNSVIPPVPQGWLDSAIKGMSDQHVRQFGGNKKAAMKAIGAQSEEDFAHRFTGQAYRELMQDLAVRKYGELYNVAPGSDEMFESMLENVRWIHDDTQA